MFPRVCSVWVWYLGVQHVWHDNEIQIQTGVPWLYHCAHEIYIGNMWHSMTPTTFCSGMMWDWARLACRWSTIDRDISRQPCAQRHNQGTTHFSHHICVTRQHVWHADGALCVCAIYCHTRHILSCIQRRDVLCACSVTPSMYVCQLCSVWSVQVSVCASVTRRDSTCVMTCCTSRYHTLVHKYNTSVSASAGATCCVHVLWHELCVYTN